MTPARLRTADRRTRCRCPRCGTADTARIPRAGLRAGGRDSAGGRRRQTSRRTSRWRCQIGYSSGLAWRVRRRPGLASEVLQAQRDPLESSPKFTLTEALAGGVIFGIYSGPLGAFVNVTIVYELARRLCV